MISYEQVQTLIEASRKEGKLYHYNGGQAYIRISNSSDALLIIDHSLVANIRVSLEDGSNYFKNNSPYVSDSKYSDPEWTFEKMYGEYLEDIKEKA